MVVFFETNQPRNMESPIQTIVCTDKRKNVYEENGQLMNCSEEGESTESSAESYTTYHIIIGTQRYELELIQGEHYEYLLHYCINEIFDGVLTDKDFFMVVDGRIIEKDHECYESQKSLKIHIRGRGGSTKGKGKGEKRKQHSNKGELNVKMSLKAKTSCYALLRKGKIQELSEDNKKKLSAFKKFHSDEVLIIEEELAAEEVEKSKEQVAYDTSRIQKKKNHNSVNAFAQAAIRKFTGMENASKVIGPQPKEVVYSKLSTADRQKIEDDEVSPDVDEYETVTFDYYEPKNFLFYLTGKMTMRQGVLPRYVIQMINTQACMSSSPINFNNMMMKIFKDSRTSELVKEFNPEEMRALKKNVTAYYLALQYDEEVTMISKVNRIINTARRANNLDYKSKVDIGFNINSIILTIRELISKVFSIVGNMVLNALMRSKIPEFINGLKDKLAIWLGADEEESKEFELDCVVELKDEDDGNMSIIKPFPTVSAYVEETIKEIIPGGSIIIGYLDDYVNESTHRAKWHRESMKYPFLERLRIHLKHNAQNKEYRMKGELQEYYTYKTQSGEIIEECAEPIVDILPSGTKLGSAPLSTVDEHLLEDYPWPCNQNSDYTEHIRKNADGFYPLLFPATNLVTYDNTFENLRATIYLRLLQPKTIGAVPGTWAKITEDLFTFNFDFHPDHEKWYAGLTPHQKS
jgi:hypothetical protein